LVLFYPYPEYASNESIHHDEYMPLLCVFDFYRLFNSDNVILWI